jgi:hypothetical protein
MTGISFVFGSRETEFLGYQPSCMPSHSILRVGDAYRYATLSSPKYVPPPNSRTFAHQMHLDTAQKAVSSAIILSNVWTAQTSGLSPAFSASSSTAAGIPPLSASLAFFFFLIRFSP